jgi:ATP-dependent Clp protease adapter protein ClpS
VADLLLGIDVGTASSMGVLLGTDGVTVARGHEIAQTIHNSGQAIVWSGAREPAEHDWEQLRAAGLTLAPLERG